MGWQSCDQLYVDPLLKLALKSFGCFINCEADDLPTCWLCLTAVSLTIFLGLSESVVAGASSEAVAGAGLEAFSAAAAAAAAALASLSRSSFFFWVICA
jgi:hypothetical protein